MHPQRERLASLANQEAHPAGRSESLSSGQENLADLTPRAYPSPPPRLLNHRMDAQHRGEQGREQEKEQVFGTSSKLLEPVNPWAYKRQIYILFLKPRRLGFLSLSLEEIPTKIKSLTGAGVQVRKAGRPLSLSLPTPTPVPDPALLWVQKAPGESPGQGVMQVTNNTIPVANYLLSYQ